MTVPQQMQSQVLNSVTQGQQAAVQAATTMFEAWSDALRQAGGSGAQGDALPGSAGLPKPADVVDQVFDFWVQLLEAQRAVAHSWVGASVPGAPASGQVADPTPRKAPPAAEATLSTTAGPTPPSMPTAGTTAASTPDEHISAAAADAIASAADSTAQKTRS